MVDPDPPQLPRLMAEVLGTSAIPSELSVIPVGRFRTVHEDGTALLLEKRSGRGIQYFLVLLASGVDHIHSLEQVSLIGVDQDITLHLLHSLLFVPFNLYCTSRYLLVCRGELTSEETPTVVEIVHKSLVARRSIHAMPRVDHVSHLGGISPPHWQTILFERVGKIAGAEHYNVDCRGLTLAPPE